MKFFKRLFWTMLIIAILVVGGITFMGYTMYSNAIKETSISERIATIRKDENYININDVPDNFKNAIIAVEDHRFREHNGIDIITTIRCMIENIREKEYNYSTNW